MKPDISKLVPFGTVTFANMTKEKKASKAAQAKKMGEQFDTSKESEKGIMVGFHTLFSNTCKVLLLSQRVIHSGQDLQVQP